MPGWKSSVDGRVQPILIGHRPPWLRGRPITPGRSRKCRPNWQGWSKTLPEFRLPCERQIYDPLRAVGHKSGYRTCGG